MHIFFHIHIYQRHKWFLSVSDFARCPKDGAVAVRVLERAVCVRNDKRHLELLEKNKAWHQSFLETVHSEMVLRILLESSDPVFEGRILWSPSVRRGDNKNPIRGEHFLWLVQPLPRILKSVN